MRSQNTRTFPPKCWEQLDALHYNRTHHTDPNTSEKYSGLLTPQTYINCILLPFRAVSMFILGLSVIRTKHQLHSTIMKKVPAQVSEEVLAEEWLPFAWIP